MRILGRASGATLYGNTVFLPVERKFASTEWSESVNANRARQWQGYI
jgi:hypothetical protein